VLQCVAVCVVLHVAACCSELQCADGMAPQDALNICVVCCGVRCSVLQCVL